MRAVLAVVLSLATGCSYLTSQTPGPKCEESGADIADATTAVVTGLLTTILWVGTASECDNGCSSDAPELAASAIALTATTALFAASAVHGSAENDACRRARGLPDDE